MIRTTKTAAMLGILGTIILGSASASQAADPAFAYTGDPAYAYSRNYDSSRYANSPADAYSPGYQSYAYAPGYRGYGYHTETRSVPRHYDPGGGYNSNTVAPWQDWRLQGHDY